MSATTRQMILKYLQQHASVCAHDLSEAIMITRADAQHHLQSMLDEGLIELVPSMSPSRGRPRRYYALGTQVRRNNCAGLAHALLNILSAGENPGDKALPSPSFIATLAANLLPATASTSSVTVRLNQLVKRLNEAGYESRWEARSSGAFLEFRSCPYASLISAHPELCQVDQAILENNSGRTVEQVAKIGLPQFESCIFMIHIRR